MVNWQLISYLSIGLGAAMMIQFYKGYTSSSKKLKSIRRLNLIRYSEIDRSGKNGEWVFVKDKIKNQQLWEIKYPIDSNQVLFNDIPISLIRNSIYSRIYGNPQLQADSARPLIILQGSPQKLIPVPIIVNQNLIKISASYQSIFEGQQKPGVFQTIIKYALAAIAAVPQAVHQLFTQSSARRGPFIVGPIWGTLTFISSLVTDTAFVVCYRIQDSNLIPQMIGLNKADLINKVEQMKKIYLILFCTLGGLLIGLKWRRLRRGIDEFWSICSDMWRQRFSAQRRKKIYLTQVGEDQNCIICYARCRNIIFKRCRHMIICDRCSNDPDNVIEFCPTCRVPNDSGMIKVVSQN